MSTFPCVDFATAKPRDVIAHSILMHPSLYREAMQSAADSHASHAATTYHKESARIAADCATACREVSELIDSEDVDAIMQGGLKFWIPALNIAARLQCMPRHVVTDIVARWEAICAAS